MMSIAQASAITGIATDLLEANQVKLDQNPIPVPDVRFFRYPFKELSVGGLALVNPSIVLYSRGGCKPHSQWPPLTADGVACTANLTLGRSELRNFHLYFAFGEGNLYVTAADAHK
jgi:hypothetical protein